MQSTYTNGASNPQINFQEFFTKWQQEQNTQLHELVNASKTTNPPPKDSYISGLVQRIVTRYEEYYKAKSSFAKGEVFPILSPNWNTPLENAFTWVGGWRPSTAFHLLYSLSGLQLEAKLIELLSGSSNTGDLSDLSSAQLVQIDTLQSSTISEERKITEKMVKQQEKVADTDMVDLSHVMSESIRMDGDRGDDFVDMDRVDAAIKPKEEGFENILGRADDLRMKTLKAVIDILSPIQAVHFLIAAAELQLRLHEWGKEKEEKQMAAAQSLQTATAAEASYSKTSINE